MSRFLLTRLGYAGVSLLLLALTIFVLTRASGDPALLLTEPGASAADLAAVRARFGLDQPLPLQFAAFLSSALRGDFGVSLYYRTPVLDLYLQRLPNSLLLAGVAFAWSMLLGVGCGVLAALHPHRWWDHVVRILALGGLAIPAFWLGMLLILAFSVGLEWLPSSGDGTWLHLVLPALTLGWYFAAAHMRLTRSSMLEVLGSDYVKLARIKGLPETRVILVHALKNALIPVLTLAGISLVTMVNAAVVVETVFAWPGIGRLLYEGVSLRDFPVVQTTVLLAGAMIIVVNLLVDLLYAWIDPRIRHG
ncbi:MAG: ABC transporter permease [Burkholderiales bacterium]|nr:ABC transporter permease [Burkholderiales bacterium]